MHSDTTHDLNDSRHATHTALAPATYSPKPSPSSFSTEGDSYFDIHTNGVRPTTSERSSLDLPVDHAQTCAALTALQYLPVPVLVLNSQKHVIQANDAMGRLLGIGIELTESAEEDEVAASTSGVLRGQSVSQLGIEILVSGSPVLINWEVRYRTHFGLQNPWPRS